MDIALVLGIKLFLRYCFDNDRYYHQKYSAAVKCRYRQHVHYCKVNGYEGREIQHAVHCVGRARGRAARLVHHIDYSDGSRHIVNADCAVDKVTESEPDKARKFLGRVPDILKLHAERGLFNAPDEAVFESLLAFNGRNELHILKLDLLPVAQHDDIVNAVSALKEHRNVAYEVYPVAVNAVKLITGLKGLRRIILASVKKISDYRGSEGFRSAVHDDDQYNAEQEIHERACAQDEKALPKALIGKCAGILRFLVLAHGAEAAYGENAQRIQRLSPLLFDYCRSHAYRKFIHAHAAGLGRCEVAEFVDGDKHAEHYYCDNDIH